MSPSPHLNEPGEFLKARRSELTPRAVGLPETLDHPVAGQLSLDWDTLTAATDPGQQLVVWTAEAGSPTYDRLRVLAPWAADHAISSAS